MSTWFVVTGTPANLDARIALFAATYLGHGVRGSDSLGEDEKVGGMVRNASGTAAFTGSSRVGAPTAQQIGLTHVPWLDVHETPAFFDDWEYPLNE